MRAAIAAFVLSAALTSCEILKLKFSENNVDYEEEIKISNSSVEYQVPKHGNREKSGYLSDFDAKIMATKRYEHQKCYIYDMPKYIYKPDEVKEGVKKYQGKFPEDRYLMQKEYIVPLYYMNVTTVPAKIRDFCNPFPMMRVKIFDSKKEMEANFFKLVTAKTSGSRQKRGTHTSFTSCTQEGAYKAKRCAELNKMPTGKYCQYGSSGCKYRVICTSTGFMSWHCPLPSHVSDYTLTCCDYTCD